jgi:hypothetical protein
MKKKYYNRVISVADELRLYFDRVLKSAKSKGCDDDFTFAFHCVVSGAIVALRTVCKLSDSDADDLTEWMISEFKDYGGKKSE